MVHRYLAALALLIALAGCKTDESFSGLVDSRSYDIAGTNLMLAATGTGRLAVAAIDERPDVLHGGESRGFLGTERGNWSRPVSVKTASGRGFAEDLTDLVAGALARGGTDATALPLAGNAGEAEALAAFQAQGADRLLLIRVQDWRSEAIVRMLLHWRLQASVLDRNGTVLGSNAGSGDGPVGSVGARDTGERITQRELALHLANLLGDPQITRALH